jgi:hypothetical protein
MKARARAIGAVVVLILLAGVVTQVTLRRALHEMGWPDEWIYLTLARNIAERGTLNTNFYLASSIDAIGYPHRDVHLPGYALVLAAFGSFHGYTFDTAAMVNVVSYVITVLCAFFLARAFFSVERSFAAAALVAVLPPYPGYLAVAYPEHVTAAALLVLVTIAFWIEDAVPVFVLGFLTGASLLFRETVLFALPLFAHRFGAKRFFRYFLPGLLLCLVTVLPPLSRNRAVHPNALYPSAITEALRNPEPVSTLVSTIVENAVTNLQLLFTSNPLKGAEDAVLIFLLALAVIGLGACRRIQGKERGFLVATVISTALLLAAMIAIYVVRERGGVWGGVRALMPMAPLLVIGLCGLRPNRTALGLLVTSLVSASLFLDSWQIQAFNRYKGTNLEDQDRAATFIETRTKRFAPRRVVGGRYFQYGYRNFPVEVVWSGVDTMANLNRLYAKMPFDFVVIHRRSVMRFDLRKDERYEWVNAEEGQAAEYQIYRRVVP